MLSLLADREFRAFLVANCTERFAASALTVLLGFQVYALTGDPLDLGLLGLVEAIPGVTLVLYGGHIADRHSRRRIVLGTTALLAVLAGGAASVSGLAQQHLLAVLFCVAFLAGVVRAFEGPAASGLEAQVVPLSQLVRGMSLLAISGRLADLLGPVAGGIAWQAFGPAGTYGAIAALFAAACIVLLLGTREKAAAHVIAVSGQTAFGRIAEGVRFVFRDQILIGSMLLDLFAVFFGGATALLPAIATDVLHTGPVGFGFLRAAISAGSFTAALLVGRYLPQRQAGVALLAVIGGFGVSMVAFGLSRSLPLSLLALFVAGLCDGTSVVIRRAILRLCSPEAMRGRIAAVKTVFVGSSNEIGAFESGVAASLIGVTAAIWAGGLVTLGIVAFTAWWAPKLRRLDLVALAEAEAALQDAAGPIERKGTVRCA